MISLLHGCNIYVDNGHFFDGEENYRPHWERCPFDVGEEIDESDPTFNIEDLTEGEDFVRL